MNRFQTIITSLAALLAAAALSSCAPKQDAPAGPHPDWAYNAVIYEMNIRQYTSEWMYSGSCRYIPSG